MESEKGLSDDATLADRVKPKRSDVNPGNERTLGQGA